MFEAIFTAKFVSNIVNSLLIIVVSDNIIHNVKQQTIQCTQSKIEQSKQ